MPRPIHNTPVHKVVRKGWLTPLPLPFRLIVMLKWTNKMVDREILGLPLFEVYLQVLGLPAPPEVSKSLGLPLLQVHLQVLLPSICCLGYIESIDELHLKTNIFLTFVNFWNYEGGNCATMQRELS